MKGLEYKTDLIQTQVCQCGLSEQVNTFTIDGNLTTIESIEPTDGVQERGFTGS